MAEDTDPRPTRDVTSLLDGLFALVQKVQSLSLTDYETRDDADLGALVGGVRDDLLAAIECLSSASRLYDSGEAPAETADAAFDEDAEALPPTPEAPSPTSMILGLAFIARFSLRNHAARLDAIAPDADLWEVISNCGRAVGEMLKSLSALELAVCSLERIAPRTNFYLSVIDRSLRVRHAYVCFRRSVLDLGPGGGEIDALRRRLRLTGSALAKLVGREIYPTARVHDRWMIRHLQRQIREWLQRGADGDSPDALAASGAHLWQEIVNVTELLMQVNNREELRVYDAEALDEALARLRDGTFGAADVAKLQNVWGREAELDTLLDARASADDPAWTVALRAARRQLERAPSPRPQLPSSVVPRERLSRPPGEARAIPARAE